MPKAHITCISRVMVRTSNQLFVLLYHILINLIFFKTEAGQFRKRLVNEVYPELSLYLTDFEVETLARNLGCQLWKLKNRFGLVKAPGLISTCFFFVFVNGIITICVHIVGIRNIVAGKIGKKVNKNWHIRVWTSLKALCTKPRVLEAIIQYENVGHEKLARMLFGMYPLLTCYLLQCQLTLIQGGPFLH